MAGKINFRWPRPQFSLATFLIFVTLISPLIGYVAHRRAVNDRRAAALAKLSQRAYAVGDFNSLDGFSSTREKIGKLSYAQKCWRQLCKDNENVYMGYFSRNRYTSAEDLRLLMHFPELTKLVVQLHPSCIEDDLLPLADLPRLKHLVIYHSPQVTGAFLNDFAARSSIECLELESLPNLRSESLIALGRFRKLSGFYLRDCQSITHGSLRNVQFPPSMTTLSIIDREIDDETIGRWLTQSNLVEVSREYQHPVRTFARPQGEKPAEGSF